MFIEIIGFIAIIIIVGFQGWAPVEWRWVTMMVAFTLFLGVVGKQVTHDQINGKKGRIDGILIDNRYKMSLSRFQIILWTVLALSAFTVISLDRVSASLNEEAITAQPATGQQSETPDTQVDTYSPLNIRFPDELLIAMGISVTSLAGASWIKSKKTETQSSKVISLLSDQRITATKRLDSANEAFKKAEDKLADIADQIQAYKNIPETDVPAYQKAQLELERIEKVDKPAAAAELEAAKKNLETSQKELTEIQKGEESRKGDIHVNDNLEQANWGDMFRGELVSNWRLVDPSKIQMFLISILLIFTYATLIWVQLSGDPSWRTDLIVDLPSFSDSMVAFLGISHAGYLVIKQTGD